jgi:hypothetical protein
MKKFSKSFTLAEQKLIPVPGKALLGVLFQKNQDYQELKQYIEKIGFEVELESEEMKFDFTDYYDKEMGSELRRIFVSLKGIYPLDESVLFKHETIEWESKWRVNNFRTVNIDPGYLDLHKLILLSGKQGPQKIYLGQRVWADLCLLRKSGHFQTLPWTFPDLRNGFHHIFFEKVRDIFKKDIKKGSEN